MKVLWIENTTRVQALEEVPPDNSKTVIICNIMIFLALMMLAFGLVLQVKVFKLMQFKRISLSLAVFSINLALMSSITSMVILNRFVLSAERSGRLYNVFRVFDILRELFTLSSYLFTLYLWGLFVIYSSLGAEGGERKT